MPSRPAAAAVVLFWLAVVGYQGYARVLPWLAASAAPAVTVSATDEASRLKVRWTVSLRTGTGGFEKAGYLTSELKVDDADTFTFVAKYTDIRLSVLGFAVRVPAATTEVTIGRDGGLRKQSMSGTGVFAMGLLGGDITASASVVSHVVGGELRGRAEGAILDFRLDPTDLPPVPVPSGQVLNPLLPVNRLAGVEPGMRPWTIRRVDPLGDSLRQLGLALLEKNGVKSALLGGPDAGQELLAEVLPETEGVAVRRHEETVPCRVIAYKGRDGTAAARTWVSAADGRVMRQEATAGDHTLRLDRDE